jgi:predicted lactoylglutathione lyase
MKSEVYVNLPVKDLKRSTAFFGLIFMEPDK